jgi:hypothetical protein
MPMTMTVLSMAGHDTPLPYTTRDPSAELNAIVLPGIDPQFNLEAVAWQVRKAVEECLAQTRARYLQSVPRFRSSGLSWES